MVRYFCILTVFLFSACETETTPQVDDRAYFPVSLDNEWTYSYTETIYSVTQEPKVNEFLYREKLGSLIDEKNRIYKLDRSLKPKTASTWNSLAPLLLKVNANRITIVRDNTEEDLLIFPIQNGNKWQNEESENTVFTSLGYFPLGSNQIGVQAINDSSAIDLKRSFKVYELGTGLVYSEISNIAYCQETPDCIGKGLISSGSKIVYQLLEKKIN